MRALYLPAAFAPSLADYSVIDEAFHHLVNVTRIKLGETVLLLNGEGKSRISTVTNIEKKRLALKLNDVKTHLPLTNFSIAIGVTKRDALDLMLKMSVELGAQHIYLVNMEYSQERIPDDNRIKSLLVSSLEQSNNPFLPHVSVLENLSVLPWDNYQQVYVFHPQGQSRAPTIGLSQKLIVIGPEGGFSESEIALLTTRATIVKFPTPILRSPTALACASGWLLSGEFT